MVVNILDGKTTEMKSQRGGVRATQSQICNFVSGHARDSILVSIPRFLVMTNSLGPFSDS